MRRCDKYKGIWIPGCWARALNENECNCDPADPLTLAHEVDELRDRVAELKSRLEQLAKDFPGTGTR